MTEAEALEKAKIALWWRDGWARAHHGRPRDGRLPPLHKFYFTNEEYLWCKCCKAGHRLAAQLSVLDTVRLRAKEQETFDPCI